MNDRALNHKKNISHLVRDPQKNDRAQDERASKDFESVLDGLKNEGRHLQKKS
jgi:hypothetical protein